MSAISRAAIGFSVRQVVMLLNLSLTHVLSGKLAATAMACHCCMIFYTWRRTAESRA